MEIKIGFETLRERTIGEVLNLENSILKELKGGCQDVNKKNRLYKWKL